MDQIDDLGETKSGSNDNHCYYIEKYNLLAVVQEGRSLIYFYNCKNFEKLKSYIDLNEIQKEIDDLEIKELDLRAEENTKKEIIEREEKIKKQKNMMKITFNKTTKNGFYSSNKSNNKFKKPKITSETFITLHQQMIPHLILTKRKQTQ